MSFTQTPNYGLYKPTINADNDQWGTHLNANADTLDAQLLTGSGNNVGRNLVHNSMFAIAQRSVGPFTTNVYTVDRWVNGFTNGTLSTSQIVLTDADRAGIGDEAAIYAMQCVVTGGGGAASYTTIYQQIESVRRLSGKTVTISFWAKAASGTPKISVSLDQNFGTGGSPSAYLPGIGLAVTVATTWARYNITLTIPSAAGKVLGTNANDAVAINVWFSSGSTNNVNAGGIGVQSGTFTLWGVQLEVGSVATPLEKLDPVLRLQQCQRFYQTGVTQYYAYGGAGQVFAIQIPLPVTMRAAPAVVYTPTLSGNATGIALTASTAGSLGYNGTVTAAGGFTAQGSYTASADL